MSTHTLPNGGRKYGGKFGLPRAYPTTVFSNRHPVRKLFIEAKTVSLVVPHREAIQLPTVMLKASAEHQEELEIKVDRREGKRGKGNSLPPATITWQTRSG